MQAVLKGESQWCMLGPKMANVLTDPCRARILMELSVRPMSPSQFVEKVGGELNYISRCFRQLADWDYIELVEERPGRRRGASVEHVYRAVQRAHFDTATWEGLPRFQKDVVSDSILGSYFARVTEAVRAGTFDQEIDRHLSWDGVVVDRRAWTHLVTRLDEVLDWLPQLELQAALRLAKTGEEPIPTIVSLAAFRSPQPAPIMLGAPRRQPSQTLSPEPVTVEMAKAMRNKWRSRILMELNARPLSPSQFVEEIGGSSTHISRCFRQLAEWGYIEVIEKRPGGRHGGGVEQVYRNVQRAYFDTDTWETLPQVLRCEFSNSILGSYLARITEAIKAETFDAEKDRHLSWIPLTLDRAAWQQVIRTLDELLDWLPTLQEESQNRSAGNVNLLIPTTVGLSAFRSPGSSEAIERSD